ncbi:MAG: hypothetical protein AB7N24_14375 [Dehalococcoidia bacterium]
MTTTVVARRVASTPVRTAGQTWDHIIELISAGGEPPRELVNASGIASSLIASDSPEDSPITVYGVGPRLRIYCVYGDAAVLGEMVVEDALTWKPLDGDWHISLPAFEEDVAWTSAALPPGGRISVRDKDEDVREESGSAATSAAMSVNVERFLQR